jgi:two-component system, LytTR family, sensor kinase
LHANQLRMQKLSVKQSRFFTFAIHVLIWAGLYIIPFIDDTRQHFSPHFIWRHSELFILLIAFFYFNTYFLIRKLFQPGKLLYYFLAILSCIVFISITNLAFSQIIDIAIPIPAEFHIPNYFHRLFFPVFPSLFVFAISMAIKITNEWFNSEKQKKEMENEKLHSELAFLKSQVNPHFLFNILNNICSLARKKSDDTENAIIQLSRIMRYMLYDSKDEKVSLEKEVEYLQNYIDLQRLRISDSVIIKFDIEGNIEGRMVEPMLLIPFVENAFKHGVSYLEASEIDIRLKIENEILNFSVENNKIKKNDDPVQQESGIGLKNVLRRLDLLYPGTHRINIEEKMSKYIVNLEITL